MLYRTEFTYGAKIVERGMKVLDAINTQKETEKQGLKRKVLINEKNRNRRCAILLYGFGLYKHCKVILAL